MTKYAKAVEQLNEAMLIIPTSSASRMRGHEGHSVLLNMIGGAFRRNLKRRFVTAWSLTKPDGPKNGDLMPRFFVFSAGSLLLLYFSREGKQIRRFPPPLRARPEQRHFRVHPLMFSSPRRGCNPGGKKVDLVEQLGGETS